MQTAVLGNENKYDITAPKFQTAFAFLKRSNLAKLSDGWYELDNGVRASVQHYTTFPAADLDFETHVHYFDIQYMVSGQEMIGVVNAKGLTVKVPYDKDNDIEFYNEPTFSGNVFMRTGDYIILAPEDAHKPKCAAGTPMPVAKIVVKVPVNG